MAVRFKDLCCEWRSPKTFSRVLRGLSAKFDSAELFTDPELNRASRELWAVEMFCRATFCRSARLVEHDAKNPDIEVRLRDGRVMRLQFTEAQELGRKRGKEYQDWKKEGWPTRSDPYEDWLSRREQIPQSLAASIAKKVEKQYPPEIALLVYLNIGTYGLWKAEVDAEIAEIASRFDGKFCSIWVIWNGRMRRAWPNPSSAKFDDLAFGDPVPLGLWRLETGLQKEMDRALDAPETEGEQERLAVVGR